MQTKMTARQARDNFTDLLGAVYYGNQVVEIDKKGRIFAVVVNPDEYKALKKTARGELFKVVEEIQKAYRNVDTNEIVQDVSREVEKVRQELYEKGR